MGYDYHVRMQEWDEVIAMAEKKAPDTPMSVSCLNLALAMKGQLPERMFSFYQRGKEGLLMSFVNDFTIPLVAGEPYYYLGLVNVGSSLSSRLWRPFRITGRVCVVLKGLLRPI